MQRGRTHIQPPLGYDELAEERAAARTDPVGLCLVCGADIYDESDCLEGSWIHACPENLARMEPRVGIFFVYGGKLWIESTPVSQAEPYGYCRTFGGGHPSLWSRLVAEGAVPDIPYEEPPRGRATFDMQTGEWHLYVDRCIARDVSMVWQIKDRLNLAFSVNPESDDHHYQCRVCQGDKWVPLLDA